MLEKSNLTEEEIERAKDEAWYRNYFTAGGSQRNLRDFIRPLAQAWISSNFLKQNNIVDGFTINLADKKPYFSIFIEKRNDIEYYYYTSNLGFWALLDTENIKEFLPIERLKESITSKLITKYDLIKGAKLIMKPVGGHNVLQDGFYFSKIIDEAKCFSNTSQIERLHEEILSVRSELGFSEKNRYYFDNIFNNIFRKRLSGFEVYFTFIGIILKATDPFIECKWAEFKKILQLLKDKKILKYEILDNSQRHISIQFNRTLFAIEKDLEPSFFQYLFYEISLTPVSFNRLNTENQNIEEYFDDYDEDNSEFSEGKDIERKHKLKERNPKLIAKAKEIFKKKHGKLFCQVCEFDFCKVYGELGKDYIEGHHTLPVSEMKEGNTSLVKDIALVCANCHRMLHRKRPWLSMDNLKNVLSKNTI